jgi:sulfur-carrier protein adenylyltransferase/sulfurtransferase
VPLHASQAVRASSAAALVTVPTTDVKDFLRGGQAMERIWLHLTRQGLAVQPMAAITLFWLRWKLEGPGAFSKKHQALLNSVWGEYRSLFPAVDFDKEGHVILFRLGYGRGIHCHTLRKDINTFCI